MYLNSLMSSSKIRLFIDTIQFSANQEISICGNQHHYLSKVMRIGKGDNVIIFNGHDGDWLAKVVDITNKHCSLFLCKQLKQQQLEPKLTLCFAPIKAVTPAWIVQKATELGASDIVPILTERTIVRKVNHEKMHLSAIEAAEQCERQTVPIIHPPLPLSKLLTRPNFHGKLLFCDERIPITSGLAMALKGLECKDDALLIGPEGGFTLEEKTMLQKYQFVQPISLGERILRAETATLAALALYQTFREASRK